MNDIPSIEAFKLTRGVPGIHTWWQSKSNPDLVALVAGITNSGPLKVLTLDLFARASPQFPFVEMMESTAIGVRHFHTLFHPFDASLHE